MTKQNSILVIGGGAAGFFGAINVAKANPGAHVTILEKTGKFLSKVRVSGGGRCNVTHHCFLPGILAGFYPRGNKLLKQLFQQFHAEDTVRWFDSRGVKLKTEQDGRMFPVTNSSQTIIDCFMHEAGRLNIRIEPNTAVQSIFKEKDSFLIKTTGGQLYNADKVLIATGGNAHMEAYKWIADLGHTIIQPIPSLFTFNNSARHFADLSGVAVPIAEVKIAGTKFKQSGPLLITHWGLSGPAVIKLSAWAAAYLHSTDYIFTALVSWIGENGEEETRSQLLSFKENNHLKKIYSHPLFGLPQRLWEKLCETSEIEPGKIWAELPHKQINKLLENLIRCPFQIKGKTTFKEEFVTCGGIDLKEINLETMESKIVPGLYFAGEVLDIDGITGGFNFQAAWTTAWIAAKNMSLEFRV